MLRGFLHGGEEPRSPHSPARFLARSSPNEPARCFGKILEHQSQSLMPRTPTQQRAACEAARLPGGERARRCAAALLPNTWSVHSQYCCARRAAHESRRRWRAPRSPHAACLLARDLRDAQLLCACASSTSGARAAASSRARVGATTTAERKMIERRRRRTTMTKGSLTQLVVGGEGGGKRPRRTATRRVERTRAARCFARMSGPPPLHPRGFSPPPSRAPLRATARDRATTRARLAMGVLSS